MEQRCLQTKEASDFPYLTLRCQAELGLEGLVDAETDASRHGSAVHLSMREKRENTSPNLCLFLI